MKTKTIEQIQNELDQLIFKRLAMKQNEDPNEIESKIDGLIWVLDKLREPKSISKDEAEYLRFKCGA